MAKMFLMPEVQPMVKQLANSLTLVKQLPSFRGCTSANLVCLTGESHWQCS